MPAGASRPPYALKELSPITVGRFWDELQKWLSSPVGRFSSYYTERLRARGESGTP